MLLQGNSGLAGAIAGLLAGGGQVLGGIADSKRRQEDEKRKQQAQDAALAYQKWQMQHGKTQDAIQANNAGMVLDQATGEVKPWTPPGDAGAPPQPPGLSQLLGGATTPAPPSGPATPPAGPQGTVPGPTAPQNPQATVPPELVQTAALAKAQVGSLMGVYQSESAQVQTLTAQHAPDVLIERHRKNAKDALTEAGTWMGRQQSAEAAITAATETADKKSKQAAIDSYEAGIKYPPNWNKFNPDQKIAYLQQRIQSAIQHHDKGLQDITTKQIERLQADKREGRQERHETVIEGQGERRLGLEGERVGLERLRANRPRGANGNAPSDAANAVYDRASKAKTPQEALKIIDDPKNGLNYRERTELRTSIRDQKPDKTANDPEVSGQAGTLRGQFQLWSASNPNATPTEGREWARKQGYDDAVINRVLPGGAKATPKAPQKTAVKNGKTYYMHSDGNYYLTP